VPRFRCHAAAFRDSRRPVRRIECTLGYRWSQIFETQQPFVCLWHSASKDASDCNPALISHTGKFGSGVRKAIEYRLDLLEGHDILLPCGVSARFLPTGRILQIRVLRFGWTALKSNSNSTGGDAECALRWAALRPPRVHLHQNL